MRRISEWRHNKDKHKRNPTIFLQGSWQQDAHCGNVYTIFFASSRVRPFITSRETWAARSNPNLRRWWASASTTHHNQSLGYDARAKGPRRIPHDYRGGVESPLEAVLAWLKSLNTAETEDEDKARATWQKTTSQVSARLNVSCAVVLRWRWLGWPALGKIQVNCFQTNHFPFT